MYFQLQRSQIPADLIPISFASLALRQAFSCLACCNGNAMRTSSSNETCGVRYRSSCKEVIVPGHRKEPADPVTLGHNSPCNGAIFNDSSSLYKVISSPCNALKSKRRLVSEVSAQVPAPLYLALQLHNTTCHEEHHPLLLQSDAGQERLLRSS